MGHYRPLFLYFRLFNTVDSRQMFHIKVCRWLDLNCGPPVSEATALPTEPQPLSYITITEVSKNIYWLRNIKRNQWTISLSEQQPGAVSEQLQLPEDQDPLRRVQARRGWAQGNWSSTWKGRARSKLELRRWGQAHSIELKPPFYWAKTISNGEQCFWIVGLWFHVNVDNSSSSSGIFENHFWSNDLSSLTSSSLVNSSEWWVHWSSGPIL